jgi:hypothetical protein
MSITLVKRLPAAVSTISTDLIVVSIFSLLALTITLTVLSYVSSETISMMFTPIG